ncbi:MAG: FecR domain-containing protein [Fibrobacteres bacterium]|nr:FecR domain-containing protein [Fibrobacterota bacterium]
MVRPLISAIAVFLSFSLILANPIENRGAKLNFFIGKVMVKKESDKEWKEAKIGMRLTTKDAVRTYVESKADIETPEGSVISIQENTVFELAELSENTRTKAATTTLKVNNGSVWANVKKMANQRSSFTFETPTATAAIRGTELGVEVTPSGTNVKVKEGKVEVKNKQGGKTVYVYENQVAAVKKDKDDVSVEPMKQDTTDQGAAPKEIPLELVSPTEGQQFNSPLIPIAGKTAPNALVKFSGTGDVTAGADGSFATAMSILPGSSPDQVLNVAAILGGVAVTKSVRFVCSLPKVDTVKKTDSVPPAPTAAVPPKDSIPKVAADTVPVKKAPQACPFEILEPSPGADVGLDFVIKGKIDNPSGKALVYVNGIPAQVSGNSFTAQVVTGFQRNQTATLQLSVLEPKTGSKISTLPVMIKGRVAPTLAKVLIDGAREAKVMADGTFEAEYPMSDETGDYNFEVSAVLEAGEVVRKRFEVSVQSECEGIKSPIMKTSVNVNLGTSNVAGEKKMAIAFKYEKPKYPLVLQVSPPICAGDKVAFEVKTTAVELKANGRAIPLPGPGGTLRSYRYEVSNTDQDCNNNEVVFAAADEGATPSMKEQSATWDCPVRNMDKPVLQLQDNGKSLSIRVQDQSFTCSRAEEEIKLTVDATIVGRIGEYYISSNGGSQLVPFVNGAQITYTVKAEDKGRNTVTSTYEKAGYLDRQPIVRPVNPSSFSFVKTVRANPPYPPEMAPDAEEVPVTFRIEGVEDYRLIKRVEFTGTDGSRFNYEGASIPSDLDFDDIVVTYKPSDIMTKKSAIVINYTIKITDILNNIKTQSGTLTIQGR